MKRTPKLLAIILVIIALLAVSAPAFADTGSAMVTNTLIETVGGVVQALALGGIALFFAWAQSKAIKSDRLKNALDELEKATVATVGELQQTLVESMKGANGKLTGENINELGQKSLQLIKQRMSVSAQSAIEAAGLDLQDLIRAQVEAAVTGLKKA